jgi:hypothetical protein
MPAARGRPVPKKKMWVEWEDGADLSRSQKKPGDYSPLTRDGGNNLGHVTLSDVGEEEDTDPETVWVYVTDDRETAAEAQQHAERDEQIASLAALAVMVAAQKAAPHLKRWWNDKSVPVLNAARNRLTRTRRSRSRVFVAEPFAAAETGPANSGQEVFAALDDYRASMSSAEARDRFVAALVARLFSDEQFRLLRDARVVDKGNALELASAMETLTPQQLGESIAAMLEANPSWPDEQTLAELKNVLGRGTGDAQRAPVKQKQVEEAPRTIDGER